MDKLSSKDLNAFHTDNQLREFSEWEIRQVFNKAREVALLNPAEYRVDEHGNTIRFSDFGGTGIYSWQIAHMIPLSLGGTNALSNLRPLHDVEHTEARVHATIRHLELAK